LSIIHGCIKLTVATIILSLQARPAYSGIKNIGHRVAAGRGEFHSHLPENSISALKEALTGTSYKGRPLQFHPDFVYMEFDVQETADGELVLFHDGNLTRMLPQNEKNKGAISKIVEEISKSSGAESKTPSYDKLKIHDLTINQLKSLVMANSEDERIPTLEEFLQKCREWWLFKPMTLEIKDIYSDEAREKLLDLLAYYRDIWMPRFQIIFEKGYDMDPSGVSLMSFKAKFKKSYKQKNKKLKKYWCNKIDQYGFHKVYRSMFHRDNLCS